jgi:DNA-binding NtrC family response regulator
MITACHSRMTVRRILILGTNPSAVEILHGLVRHSLGNVDVDTSTSAREAIEWLGGRRYHVVICESVLAGMTGMEFVEQTLRVSPRPTVVMLTAGEDEAACSAPIDEAVYAWVRTPLCFRTLSAVLNCAMELNRLRRQAERLRTIRSCLKGGAAYAETLRTLIIETEARMTNLREQQRADLDPDRPSAADYEATLNDLCFGWSVETNLMYTPSPHRRKEVA